MQQPTHHLSHHISRDSQFLCSSDSPAFSQAIKHTCLSSAHPTHYFNPSSPTTVCQIVVLAPVVYTSRPTNRLLVFWFLVLKPLWLSCVSLCSGSSFICLSAQLLSTLSASSAHVSLTPTASLYPLPVSPGLHIHNKISLQTLPVCVLHFGSFCENVTVRLFMVKCLKK